MAREVFGARTGLAERYAARLADQGTLRGLIGPREVPRLWERHLLNCAVLAEVIPHGARVADVGTGAGLPGVVLAIRRPDLSVTLVEPLLRRTTFLAEVVEELELSGVTVVRSRAEDLRDGGGFDVVTSRAVAPLERLVRWCLPLVAPAGAMLAMKGSSVDAEVARVGRSLRTLGGTGCEVLSLGHNVTADPVTVVRIRRTDGSARSEGR